MDLERVLQGQAAGSGAIASLNAASFITFFLKAPTRARRPGASSLAVVNTALGLEGLAFVLAGPSPQGTLEEATLLAARTALLVGAAFVSLLIGRNVARRTP